MTNSNVKNQCHISLNSRNFCRLLTISSLCFMISRAYIISTTCVVCFVCKFSISFCSLFCQSSSASFSFVQNSRSRIYLRLISIVNSRYDAIVIFTFNSIKLSRFIILRILFDVHFFSSKSIDHMYVDIAFVFHTAVFNRC